MGVKPSKKIKKLLKKIDFKWLVILLLIIGLFGQAFYFNKQIQFLNKKLNSEIAKNMETRNKLDVLGTTTAKFYDDWQKAGELTVDALIETVYDLREWQNFVDDFVVTHNENVEIYNKNVDDIWVKLNSLKRQIDILADYLFGR